MIEHAIVGVGAVGTTVAVALTLAGGRPQLCVRAPRTGLSVSSPAGTWRVDAPSTWLDPREASPARVVYVATKAHQTASAEAWLRAVTSAESTVVVLQNGVEHRERVAPLVHPAATIVPAVVDLPAQRTSVGDVVLRRAGTIALAARGVEASFGPTAPFVRVFFAPDFSSVAWRKLCVNVVSGAIPTLTDRPAEVFREPAIQDLARAMIEEVRAVARAEGVELPVGLATSIVEGFAASAPDAVNSMLLDRRAGRPLEADARHGAVVRRGARHGIATPHNAMAAALLGAMGLTER